MKAFLYLETGELFEGKWNGRVLPAKDRVGEVVFNTSHSGYEEIATDPSYMNQIVVMTAPMMGNYAVDKSVWESRRLWIEGFICVQVQNTPRDSAWIDRLDEANIPLGSDFDTRRIVMRLRSQGTPWGALFSANTTEEAKQKGQQLLQKRVVPEKDWVWLASRKETEVIPGHLNSGKKIAMLDFGCKQNIIRDLLPYCAEIKIFSSRASVSEIEQYNPDALMLTNGPGDPADVQVAPQTVKHFLGKKPIFGICMGHQVLALAMGAKTYKLKFGHRGSNHPIQDSLLNQVYISSQNHGYAVDASTLPAAVKVTQTNLNDNTVAGFYSKEWNCLGIQYHPESCPGPHDAKGLFKFFAEKML